MNDRLVGGSKGVMAPPVFPGKMRKRRNDRPPGKKIYLCGTPRNFEPSNVHDVKYYDNRRVLPKRVS